MLPVWPSGGTTPTHVWHRYGPRRPIQTPNGPTSSFHGGIDLGPWDGWGKTWLLAPFDGVVTRAAYDATFGNRVIVEATLHGDRVEAWLCHGRNNTMRVSKGDQVAQLDRLMLMGETGKASGEHIHYEIHVNGKRVDPEVFYRDLYARPAGGGSSVIPEPDPIDTPRQEEEMKYGLLHTTRPDGKMLRRAFYAPGTNYFVIWDGNDAGLANSLAKQFDTGPSLEVSYAVFEKFQNAG